MYSHMHVPLEMDVIYYCVLASVSLQLTLQLTHDDFIDSSKYTLRPRI